MPRPEMKRSGFFKGVLDGFRSSVSQPLRAESEIDETLRPEHFQVCKTVRHGFPFQPTAIAYDPVQRLLAIATKNGSLRLFGRPGVDIAIQHVLDSAVFQILFLVNEGAMITVCADDSLHLWNIRQKRPEIVHTLKFQKERITHCYLPFHSRWLYIGTERGNVHVVNIELFVLSGYLINWNKAIELSRKSHPGAIVHLSDNPVDSNKLFIGYESGTIVMWDLRNKSADIRFQYSEPLKSMSWHHDGKQFMCSHPDGSLTTWNVKNANKPQSVMYPHAKLSKDGKPEPCRPIMKVEWKTARGSDSFVAFTGGMPCDKSEQNPCLTVIHGKTTTVLEMEHSIIDFVTLCDTPWQSDFQDPYAIVVLLYNDLVVVDLTSSGYPCYQNPYPMDLHESPVTFCTYLADCSTDLIPAFYSVGGNKGNKRQGFSEKEWPINGGEWGTSTVSYPEVIITGHADGTLKFWDASSVSLQMLYKLKTSKLFEKPKARSFDSQEDDPFAIEQVSLCPESKILCVAGASVQVMMFRFKKTECTSEIPVLEVPIFYEVDDDPDCSPDTDYASRSGGKNDGLQSSASEDSGSRKMAECYLPVKVKSGPLKRAPGFQIDLICLTPVISGENPSHITALSVNSSFGLMAYGNECGLAVVDIVQKCCVVSMGTPDLYGSADPYQRVPRSPKRNTLLHGENSSSEQEKCRSPTTDQPHCHHSSEKSVPLHTQASHSSSSDSCKIPAPHSPLHDVDKPPTRPPRKKKPASCPDLSLCRVVTNNVKAEKVRDHSESRSADCANSAKTQKGSQKTVEVVCLSSSKSKSKESKTSQNASGVNDSEVEYAEDAVAALSKPKDSSHHHRKLCLSKSHILHNSSSGLEEEEVSQKMSQRRKLKKQRSVVYDLREEQQVVSPISKMFTH